MDDKSINEAFAKSLKYYMSLYGMKQNELSKRLNVATSTVSDWVNGRKTPRMSKVDAMCKIFGCSRSDFLDENSPQLSREENKVINIYRELSPRDRKLVNTFMETLSRAESID